MKLRPAYLFCTALLLLIAFAGAAQSRPQQGEQDPSVGENAPAHGENAPSHEENAPSHEENAPSHEENAPSGEENAPVVEKRAGQNEQVVRGVIMKGDTMPVVNLPELRVYERQDFEYLYLKRRYRRLIRNVKKAYPYAQVAAGRLKQLDKELAAMDSEKERKKHIDRAEKEIMDEFEKEIRRLTVTQGIILVKLIDRETGHTSYEVIRDLKGRLTAFFWQGIARLFGNNLKTEYDPGDKDRVMEDIVRGIEAGFI